jgi:phosphatidylserine synthase
MTYANETLFLTFALVLAGLFISSLPYFSKRTPSQANHYWLLAIGLDVFAFLLFAAVVTSLMLELNGTKSTT